MKNLVLDHRLIVSITLIKYCYTISSSILKYYKESNENSIR